MSKPVKPNERECLRGKRRFLRHLRGEKVQVTERRACEHCGKVVGLYVPAGGDGSCLVYRHHRDDRTGERCELSRLEPPSDRLAWESPGLRPVTWWSRAGT
jgi:hypothetical protein